jgi:hypothetical protein
MNPSKTSNIFINIVCPHRYCNVCLCPMARTYLERVINDLTGIQAPQKRKEKEEKHKPEPVQNTERQLCLFDVS